MNRLPLRSVVTVAIALAIVSFLFIRGYDRRGGIVSTAMYGEIYLTSDCPPSIVDARQAALETVKMPDGNEIVNVPEGITKPEMWQRYQVLKQSPWTIYAQASNGRRGFATYDFSSQPDGTGWNVATFRGEHVLVFVSKDATYEDVVNYARSHLSAAQLAPPFGCGISIPYKWILAALILIVTGAAIWPRRSGPSVG